MPMQRKKNIYYTIVYIVSEDGGYGGTSKTMTIALPDVRSLARYLNSFKRRYPNYRVMVAFISEANGKFIKLVKFIPAEFRAQKWLVGYKERLLANALENGIELKWNHGLKEVK